MTSRAVNILKEINLLHDRLQRRLVIFETGTIRSKKSEYHEGDGWSTFYIARRCRTARHKFYTIDLDTTVVTKFLWEKGLKPFVHIIEGDSVENLEMLINDMNIIPDFVYLDSANDKNLIMEEFLTVADYAHVVMIDDCDLDSTELLKCHEAIPYAERKV